MRLQRRFGAAFAAIAALLAACSEPAGPSRPQVNPGLTEACASVQSVNLAVGGVAPYWGPNGGILCLEGGPAGAEYLVVSSNAATDVAARLTLRTTALGVEAPSVALGAVSAAAPSPALESPLTGHAHGDGGFHMRLRRLEREELTPLMDRARAGLRSAQAGLAVTAAVPAVGDLLSFNVNARSACTNVDTRFGRVAAVTQHAVIVADTANPANGFSAADFQAIGADFDTLVVPVVVEAFGQPTDIDGNGRVIIFYTRAVNELTPRNVDYVTGGFVFARDLYPYSAGGNSATGCAGSNFAEMFYMLAPDPAGTINGNVRTLEYVRRTTVATLAHEFQHLINAGRRLYVTGATAFEAVWLDEGLAHIAEELVFRRSAGVSGGQNLGGPEITSSQRRVDAFNRYQTANIGRIEQYLNSPSPSSPMAPNDDLTTRGATWHLLRYAADRRGGNELEVWRAMSGGPAVGTANLGAAFGSDLARLFVDWNVTVAADDAVPGLPAAIDFPSWNLRTLFTALNRSEFPLRMTTLAEDVPVTTTLSGGGGAAYFRLRAPAGGRAALELLRTDGAALPTTYATTIVRTR